MATSIPHTLQRPSWSVQSIIDPAYAKLGALLKDLDQLDPGGFAFLGIPFEGLLINDIGGKGGPDGLRAALAKLRPYSIELDIDFTEPTVWLTQATSRSNILAMRSLSNAPGLPSVIYLCAEI